MPNIFTGFSNNLPCQRVVDYFKLLHLLLFFLMESGYITSKSETESCSVVSDWDTRNSTVHGILQARILEWVAYPCCSGSSWPRNWTGVSCIAGGFFTNWAIKKASNLDFNKFILLLMNLDNSYFIDYFEGFWETISCFC